MTINAISIHAPSRERHSSIRSLTNGTEFQSTLPHGSDRQSPDWPHGPTVFQSTLPHGSDFIYSNITQYTIIFQSTLPHGSD